MTRFVNDWIIIQGSPQQRPSGAAASGSTSSSGGVSSRGGGYSSYSGGGGESSSGDNKESGPPPPYEVIKIDGVRGYSYSPLFVPLTKLIRNIFGGGRKYGRDTTWIM